MDLPHYFPSSSNFSSFKNYFEIESIQEDDLALVFGYGIANGLLEKPPRQDRKNIRTTNMLNSYSRIKTIAYEARQGINSALKKEYAFLEASLGKLEGYETGVHGLASFFLTGKSNLITKKNKVEFLSQFGSRIVTEVQKGIVHPIQTQNRIHDYNLVKKVLREFR